MATPPLHHDVAGDLLDAPGQLQALTLHTLQWLRTDSLGAAIGVGGAGWRSCDYHATG